MCSLCSRDPDQLKAAREGTLMVAERLERMARILRGLASGQLKPHDDNNGGTSCARMLIRYLVEEWM